MNMFGEMSGMGSIEGVWFNKRTGRKILVRDSYISDDGMQIMTSEGDMIDGEEFSRDFIQCSNEEYDNDGNITNNSSPIDYDALFETNINNNSSSNINYNSETNLFQPEKTVEKQIINVSPKTEMLNTMFSKLNNLPTIKATIEWDNIPISEINMLKNYFDFSDDDIADFIFDKFCSINEIKASISESISKCLQ